MSFLKKLIVLLLVVIMIVMATFYSTTLNKDVVSIMKDFTRVTLYKDNIPSDYKLIDWKEKAIGYDNLVFNENATGKFLPLIWNDQKYNSFGLPAYVGDGRMHNDGAQEAVTNIAAVVSGTLMGIDKSNQDGKDYVTMLSAFFSEEEQIVLNNPAGSSETTSLWYLLYPGILFTQASILYPNNELIREYALANIDSWYKAYEIMVDDGFDYTGFNFKTMEPYRNGIWKEPDSAAGIGMLMYYGYELTNDTKYIEAAINCMNYLEQYNGSPLYEALMYFAPYLGAKLNATAGTNYDLTKMFNRLFDGTSIPRGGWGSIVGDYGNYNMNGLFGSTSDGGGYAFAMNTFAGAGAIVPMVKYDQRYAAAVGKWMLNVSSNARYFFADQTNVENQSCTYVDECQDISDDVKSFIPYEGIRKQSNGKTPWFGGDPTVYGWAKTDFSLYSGAHIGVLAALIAETDVESILKIDLNATDYIKDSFPSFLLYNPYQQEKTITYKPTSSNVTLYNTATNKVMAENVTGETKLTIPAEDALVIVEIPNDQKLDFDGVTLNIDNKYVSKNTGSVYVEGLKNNDEITSDTKIKVGFATTSFKDEIVELIVTIDDQVMTYKNTDTFKIDTSKINSSLKRVQIDVKTKLGFEDSITLRLKFK